MNGLYNHGMERRTMLLGGAALALVPGLAFAGKRPPKTRLHLGGRITHRKKEVDRKKVKFRFAIYRKNMDKDPIWDELHTLDVVDGRFEVELGKGGSLGTAVEETLNDGGLDEGGVCTTTGEGAVTMYINTLQRVPAKGAWTPD